MLSAPQILDVPAQPAAVIHLTIPCNEMMTAFGPAVGELMAALAFAHDETRARREMAEITDAFQGALPKGLQAPVRTFRH